MKNIFISLIALTVGVPVGKSDLMTCRDSWGCTCFSDLMQVRVPGTKMNLPKNEEEKRAMQLHCEVQVRQFDEFVLVTLDPFQLYKN